MSSLYFASRLFGSSSSMVCRGGEDRREEKKNIYINISPIIIIIIIGELALLLMKLFQFNLILLIINK